MTSIIATGDSYITRRLPPGDRNALELGALIQQADVRFTNLETVLRHDEGFPSAQSGGDWASSRPEVLQELRNYGFNILSWGHNHTLDYSYGGLTATQHHLEQHGFVHAGAGQNMAEASAVKYLETPVGRVAFIAATSTFHESSAAGEPRRDVVGRPGVHPLRFQNIYRITQAQLGQLQSIATMTGVNHLQDLMVREGFSLADAKGVFRFGAQLFELADEENVGEYSIPLEQDMKRFARLIDQARRSADVVLVSIHAHEMKQGRKELPADFLISFARRCIENGADAIIGHGPHELRGIEIYQNRPIFYSLGDFIFQNNTLTHYPTDFYAKYGLGSEHHAIDAVDALGASGTFGLNLNPAVWRSVVARWEIENGKLQGVQLFPISLGFDEPLYKRGWPRLTKDTSILERLAELSQEFGTEIVVEKGMGKVVF